MDRLGQAAAELVEVSPSPALTDRELRELLGRARSDPAPEEDRIVEALRDPSVGVRLLLRPKRRWSAPVGPRAWILAGDRPERAESRPRSIGERLTETLRALARAVDPDSALSWARWTRLLEEEGRVRRALRHHDRSLTPRPEDSRSGHRPETPRSTSRPPAPRRPGGTREVRPPAAAPRPRDPGPR
jgi:hypothetical protein